MDVKLHYTEVNHKAIFFRGEEAVGHRFHPDHIEKLDNPERKKLLSPELLLTNVQLEESKVVADIGCGTGFFTIPAAKLTNHQVYAIDVEPKMLAHVQERALKHNLQNILPLQGCIESIPLPDSSVDILICSLVLHEADDLEQSLRELRRVCRTNGRLLIIEWERKEAGEGPPIAERIALSDLLDKLEFLNWDCRASKPNLDQYCIIAD